MSSLIPEVHLFICMDSRVPPGATLHALDLLRAQDWQKEIVLLCDKSWEPYITVEQPALFLDKEKFFHETSASKDSIVNTQALEDFLSQLDNFEIENVLQLGDLSWGRWIKAYLDDSTTKNYQEINFASDVVTGVEVVNLVAKELGIDIATPQKEESRNSQLYIDPYVQGQISPDFKNMLEEGIEQFPVWANIIVKEEDSYYFSQLGLEDNIIDLEESSINLFNQYVLCFDNFSKHAQSSRSYNIALFNNQEKEVNCLYVAGDIVIHPKESMHLTELINLLSYWKRNRLKELAFQWINMGIEIEMVENFHHRIVKRKIQNYASDLLHCQNILDRFNQLSKDIKDRDVADFVRYMRKKNNNDPYALSFSLKILLMITDRMLASANCGERLFQRLGSDYHRIVIGEALVEGIFKKSEVEFEKIDLAKELTIFQSYLYKLDYYNDHSDLEYKNKES